MLICQLSFNFPIDQGIHLKEDWRQRRSKLTTPMIWNSKFVNLDPGNAKGHAIKKLAWRCLGTRNRTEERVPESLATVWRRLPLPGTAKNTSRIHLISCDVTGVTVRMVTRVLNKFSEPMYMDRCNVQYMSDVGTQQYRNSCVSYRTGYIHMYATHLRCLELPLEAIPSSLAS